MNTPAAQALRAAATDLADTWPSVLGEPHTNVVVAVEQIRQWLRERADRLDAEHAPTPGTRQVTVTVYDDEPGPEVAEVEAFGSGDRWRRNAHGTWDLLVLSGVPERHPWDVIAAFDDAPLVAVGSESRLRGVETDQ